MMYQECGTDWRHQVRQVMLINSAIRTVRGEKQDRDAGSQKKKNRTHLKFQRSKDDSGRSNELGGNCDVLKVLTDCSNRWY